MFICKDRSRYSRERARSRGMKQRITCTSSTESSRTKFFTTLKMCGRFTENSSNYAVPFGRNGDGAIRLSKAPCIFRLPGRSMRCFKFLFTRNHYFRSCLPSNERANIETGPADLVVHIGFEELVRLVAVLRVLEEAPSRATRYASHTWLHSLPTIRCERSVKIK